MIRLIVTYDQAGRAGAREPVTVNDYVAHMKVAGLLTAQEPISWPGKVGYQALTSGALSQELVRRIDGRSLARFYDEEVRTKFGIDVFLGLPIEEDHRYTK
ncbi:serine hydrolase family protein [Rhizorhabdus argentea]|uniref:hypothetical protein n=1 Tax=Rhizorhabdus argentea TaxID=1387174 RepID=UPI0030EB8DCD